MMMRKKKMMTMMQTQRTAARSAPHSSFQVRKSGIPGARSGPYFPAVDPPLALTGEPVINMVRDGCGSDQIRGKDKKKKEYVYSISAPNVLGSRNQILLDARMHGR
jgi:hypothetical protein